MKSKKTSLYTLLTAILLTSFIIYSCQKEDSSGLNSNNSTINNGSNGTSNGSNGCPTTSACGCSGFNKSDCNTHTICCKWTVGQGCGCK